MAVSRRHFNQLLAALPLAGGIAHADTVEIGSPRQGEDLFAYMQRVNGRFDQTLYKQLLGAANEYKEGDEAIGVAAKDDASRRNARTLLANTRIADIDAHPIFEDQLDKLIDSHVDQEKTALSQTMTLGELKTFLLEKSEEEIKQLAVGLSSDTIGCVVKLMSNEELIAVGAKVFNPLPNSNIGAKGLPGSTHSAELAHRQCR